MRRYILSRANVVALGYSVDRCPLALRFHSHCVWANY